MLSSSIRNLQLQDWIMRVRQPPGEGIFPVLLMLHGWTGNENSMWVFSSHLPQDYLCIAPRGLYAEAQGGYSWYAHRKYGLPTLTEFEPAITALLILLTPVNFPAADFTRLHLVGFSQGAALAYSFALLYPEKVTTMAGLSGFVPEASESFFRDNRLNGMPVFIAHGTQDELVPVERTRLGIGLLERAGAIVSYCEDDVGHKLSSSCFRSLGEFYKSMR